jgi:hypothetical protein
MYLQSINKYKDQYISKMVKNIFWEAWAIIPLLLCRLRPTLVWSPWSTAKQMWALRAIWNTGFWHWDKDDSNVTGGWRTQPGLRYTIYIPGTEIEIRTAYIFYHPGKFYFVTSTDWKKKHYWSFAGSSDDRTTDFTFNPRSLIRFVFNNDIATKPSEFIGFTCVLITRPISLSYFDHGSRALVGLGFLILQVPRSYSDTPHSVGLLWTSDRPVTGTSTWQYTTLTRDWHSRSRWDSNPQTEQATSHRPTP